MSVMHHGSQQLKFDFDATNAKAGHVRSALAWICVPTVHNERNYVFLIHLTKLGPRFS